MTERPTNNRVSNSRWLGPVLYLVIGAIVGGLAARAIGSDWLPTKPAGAEHPDSGSAQTARGSFAQPHADARRPDHAGWSTSAHDEVCEAQLDQALAQIETLQAAAAAEPDAAAPANADWLEDFELAELSPDQEAAVRPLLDEALQDPSMDYHAECRGDVCRVEIVSEGDDAKDAFDLLLDASNYGDIAESLKTGPAAPTVDPTSKKNVWLQTAWIKLHDREELSGWDLLGELFDGFTSYEPLEDECMELAGTGTLVVMLTVSDTGEITAETGGGLASTPAGQCAVEKLGDYLDERGGVTKPVSSSTRTFKLDKQDG